MTEQWKEIDNWPGHFISNLGRWRKGNTIRATVPNRARRNYHYAYHSSRDIRPRAQAVHRLVARHFIPNDHNKPCVNHKDNNPENNRVDNLEWATHLENSAHAKRQDRFARQYGEMCGNSKLTEKEVVAIFKSIGTKTYKEIAKEFNTAYSNVAHIARGSRWGEVTKHLV